MSLKKEQIAIAALIVIAAGAIVYGNLTANRLTMENTQLVSQLTGLKSQLDAIQTTQQSDNEQLKLYEAIVQSQSDKVDHYKEILSEQIVIMEAEGISTARYIHLYRFDDMWNPKIIYLLSDKSLYDAEAMSDLTDDDVSNKLKDVIQRMSVEVFDYLPIQLERLEKIDGGYKAYIDLEELPNTDNDDQYRGWANLYFQGSSGGGATERALIYNILQPEMANWPITSVVFTYAHETIYFDHVPELADVIERGSLTDH
jgi:hypothetical protein